MTHTITFVRHRRRREGKTNYKKRLILLKSRLPRVVVRRTNKNIIVQVIEYAPKGDRILCGANSQELKKLGWGYSTKSIPAAYLAGKLLVWKMKQKNLPQNEMILDIGIHTPVKGSRLYAAVKGIIDSGITIPAGDDIFPSEDRIHGKHIVDHCRSKKQKQMFTTYNIEKFSQSFDELSKKLS